MLAEAAAMLAEAAAMPQLYSNSDPPTKELLVSMDEVTDATWEEQVVGSDRPVVVDFWAPWCGPCRVMDPILDELSEQHGGKVKFTKLNVDDNFQTAARYDILSIPTVILFESGEARGSVVGVRPRAHFEQWLAEVLPARK